MSASRPAGWSEQEWAALVAEGGVPRVLPSEQRPAKRLSPPATPYRGERDLASARGWAERPHRERRLSVGDRVLDAEQALQSIAELWPVLAGQLVGRGGPHFTARQTDRPEVPTTCPGCGAPLVERPPHPREVVEAVLAGRAPRQSRMACRSCDTVVHASGSPAPTSTQLLEVRAEVESGLLVLERELAARLGLGDPVDAAVPARCARLGHLVRLMAEGDGLRPAVERELLALDRSVRRALRDAEPRLPLAEPCPDCDRRTLVMTDAETVVCTRRHEILDDAGEPIRCRRWAGERMIARLALTVGDGVTVVNGQEFVTTTAAARRLSTRPGTIRQWKHRNLLSSAGSVGSRGESMFAWSDVLEAERVARLRLAGQRGAGARPDAV